MTDQQPRYRPTDLANPRACRFPRCRAKSIRGHAFCQRHAASDEAVRYYRELERATAYFDIALQSVDPAQTARAEAHHRFRRRVQRGDFSQLLDKPTRRLIEQAAARPDFDLELGVLRYALVRTVAEETDPARMGTTLARLSHAIARITAADADQAARRDPTDPSTAAILRLLDTALPAPPSSLPGLAEGPGIEADRRPPHPDNQ